MFWPLIFGWNQLTGSALAPQEVHLWGFTPILLPDMQLEMPHKIERPQNEQT
jgi:hypothetical protein